MKMNSIFLLMTNLVMKKNKNRGWFKKLPGGEFNKHQLFNRGEDFKHNAIMYILKARQTLIQMLFYVYGRRKTKLSAKFNGNDCGWIIYCSVENAINKGMIKT